MPAMVSCRSSALTRTSCVPLMMRLPFGRTSVTIAATESLRFSDRVVSPVPVWRELEPTSKPADAAPTEGPLDAQITPDNSYASLIAAINANEAVDLSAVTDEAKVSIVLVSSLTGDATTEGAALDAAVTAQTEALTTLRADATANAVINAKLTAEGHTADDIVAIRTDASGNTLVYVDDRS